MSIAKKRIYLNMITKNIWLLIGALTVLCAGVVGVDAYLSKKAAPVVGNSEEELLEEQTSTEPEGISSTSEIDTSNWKTYKNEEYGFEIRYPKSWHIYKSYEIIVISTYPEDTLEIPSAYGLITINHRINITLDKLLETYKGLTEHPKSSNIFPGSKEFFFEKITIDAVKGHKVTAISKEGVNESGIVYFLPDRSNQGFFQFIGSFKGNKNEKHAQRFEKMLSTFKFTE